MRCPYCSDLDNRVLDSRLTDEERSIRRRRECAKCGKRFTTYERFEETVLMVVKSHVPSAPPGRRLANRFQVA